MRRVLVVALLAAGLLLAGSVGALAHTVPPSGPEQGCVHDHIGLPPIDEHPGDVRDDAQDNTCGRGDLTPL